MCCFRTIFVATMAVLACAPTVPAENRGNSNLAKVLIGRNEQLRIQMLLPLENDLAAKLAALDDLVYAVEMHAEQIDQGRELTNSTVRLVQIVSSINRDAAREAIAELLDHDNIRVAMIAADALGHHRRIDAIDALKRQVERDEWDTHYGFRFNLVRSLALMDHPDAYEFLALIRKRTDGQLLHELNKILKDVSLDEMGGKEKVLANIQGKEDPKRLTFKNASYSESYNRMRLEKQQYYGIDIEAKRLLFIIDHSGSMKAPMYRGTRLSRAKQTLIAAIRELPDDHEFGIIFFENNVREWKDGLVVASDRNKRDAIRFVSRLGYGGKTNTYGALRKSLDFDDDLEAVFLLSDGIPTTGQIVAPQGILNDIVLRNRIRHLKINTIGMGLNAPTREFLRQLATQCSGEFREPDRNDPE